jgi:acyl-CoA synthetase (AMP-forming)/AMP-acid ligase II
MLLAPMTLNHVLASLQRENVGLTFLAGPPFFVTYKELGALVRGNALHFRALGIRPGDRVAMTLETSLEHIVVFLSLIALGAIPVLLQHGTRDMAQQARRQRASFVHHDLPASGSARSFTWNPAAESEDRSAITAAVPEQIAYVSNATATKHGALMARITAILGVDRRDRDTIGYTFLPLSEDTGLVAGLLSNLVYENPLYLSPMAEFLKRPADFFSRFDCSPRVFCPMTDFALRHLVRFVESRKGRIDRRLLSCLATVYCGEPLRRSTVTSLLAIARRVGFDPCALAGAYSGPKKCVATISATSSWKEPSARRSGQYMTPRRVALTTRTTASSNVN